MFLGEKSSLRARLRGIRAIHTYNIYPILHYPPLILSRSLRLRAKKYPQFSIELPLIVSRSLRSLTNKLVSLKGKEWWRMKSKKKTTTAKQKQNKKNNNNNNNFEVGAQ